MKSIHFDLMIMRNFMSYQNSMYVRFSLIQNTLNIQL